MNDSCKGFAFASWDITIKDWLVLFEAQNMISTRPLFMRSFEDLLNHACFLCDVPALQTLWTPLGIHQKCRGSIEQMVSFKPSSIVNNGEILTFGCFRIWSPRLSLLVKDLWQSGLSHLYLYSNCQSQITFDDDWCQYYFAMIDSVMLVEVEIMDKRFVTTANLFNLFRNQDGYSQEWSAYWMMIICLV